MQKKEEMVAVRVSELRNLCIRRLRNVQVPENEAEIISDILIEADQRGVHSHGVVCLPRYIDLMERGKMQKKLQYQILTDSESVIILDGNHSNGQLLGAQGMKLAIDRARIYGIAAVGIRNSNHFGAGAYYSKMAALKGMIGITISTGAPTMAPWGGAERIIGNNPIAIAVPVKEKDPLILDMAMSVVAFGKITNMEKQGIPYIPEGWALDKEGKETTDISKVYSVIPVGGYKGYGLALMIDILAGILIGGATGARAGDDQDGPSQMFVAMDISKYGNEKSFNQDLADRIQEIKSCRLSEGTKEILMPGELENITYKHSLEYVNLIREIYEELQNK